MEGSRGAAIRPGPPEFEMWLGPGLASGGLWQYRLLSHCVPIIHALRPPYTQGKVSPPALPSAAQCRCCKTEPHQYFTCLEHWVLHLCICESEAKVTNQKSSCFSLFLYLQDACLLKHEVCTGKMLVYQTRYEASFLGKLGL